MKKFAAIKQMKNQKGVTLIELMVGIVIVALIIGGIVGIIGLVRGDSKSDVEGKRLQFGMEKVLGYLATSADTSSVNNALAVRLGAIPPDAVQAGNIITNKFGGQTVYAPAQINNPNDAVGATLNAVDERSCLNFTKSQGGSFTRVRVNGAVVKNPTDANVVEANLTAACNNAAAGNVLLFERLKS